MYNGKPLIAFLGYVLPYGQMSLWGFNFSVSPTCYFQPVILESFSPSSDIDVQTLISVYLIKGNLANRMKAFSRIGPHNKEVISLISGTLLGDSHAEWRSNGKGTRIGFYQEASHVEYLL